MPTAKPDYPFEGIVFETIPSGDTQRTTPNALPFRSRWSDLAADIEKDGKPRGFPVPAQYFVDRGAKPEKVTTVYLRTKLRDQFKKWTAEAPAAKRGERFELVLLNGTGGSDPGVRAILKMKG
ncbi:hypothetical protein [Labrys wisconsinensis]|uniref:Uncharacterized protein n=1 Tax=Labrys wisconsinensis TaxID=425677 RepID=A0ABU0JNN2_9HYPH|nr:hypothetical protein [Labrys wisconsinensis]MDQ0475245.1 hypothetical protein [Labrys wisconsinensis]